MELKHYLKSYRIRHNMTQQEMADLIGTSQVYYSNIESGRYKPGFMLIRRISVKLDIPVEKVRGMIKNED